MFFVCKGLSVLKNMFFVKSGCMCGFCIIGLRLFKILINILIICNFCCVVILKLIWKVNLSWEWLECKFF